MIDFLLQQKKTFFLVLFLAFLVRLYGFNNPIGDWHSWRQADTSSVSRNFIKFGFDLLHPRFDDLSNVASGKDNPMGYRFVEFPVYNLSQAGFYKVFDFFTIEQWGRLLTICSSLLGVSFLYFIVKKNLGVKAGLFVAFFYAFLPFDIYYGRTILPDQSMITMVLGVIFFFDLWTERNPQLVLNRYYFFSLLFMILALLLKPYAIFFAVPLFVMVWQRFGLSAFKKWQLWFFLIVSLLPLALWRLWMIRYPEGIPQNAWLFNGNGIRFRPAFFRWILYERLTKLILGYFGAVLLLLGVFKALKMRQAFFYFSFLVSSVLYVCVLATGNVQHDYYQILIMPSIALFVGLGAYALSQDKTKLLTLRLGPVILVICTVLSLFFSWQSVKDYFLIEHPDIVSAGAVVDKLTPNTAKVIAINEGFEGDTSFLYQTKRQGWASFEKPLDQMIHLGADYLVLASPTLKDYEFGKKYKIVAATSSYILFDLHKNP